MESAERELSAKQLKERATLEKEQQQKEKWETEREELQKKLVMLQHKDSQYQVHTYMCSPKQHELRKKEKLYDSLKEKMNHMLLEKNKEVKNGMEILNALQREKRTTTKGPSAKNVPT